MKLLAKEHEESNENAEVCYICKEKFENKYLKDIKYWYHSHYIGEYRGAAHSICNLQYSATKKFFIVFQNGSMIMILSKKS